MFLSYPNGALNLKVSSSYWNRETTIDTVSGKLKELSSYHSSSYPYRQDWDCCCEIIYENKRMSKIVIPNHFE